MYRTKIYAFISVYIIFSRVIQIQMQSTRLCLYKVREVNDSGERDLGGSGERNLEEGREGTNIYIYIHTHTHNFLLFYANTNTFYTFVFV